MGNAQLPNYPRANPAYAYLGKGYYRPPVNFYGHPRPYEAYAGKGYPAGWFSYNR